MDRHALLAMTEDWRFDKVFSRCTREDANPLFSVTARRLTADVAVQTLEG